MEAELCVTFVNAKKRYCFLVHPPSVVVLLSGEVALVYFDDDTFPTELATQHL